MGIIKFTIFIVLCSFKAFGSETQIDATTQSNITKELREEINTTELKENSKKSFSISLDAAYESNMQKHDQAAHRSSVSLEFAPSYRFDSLWTVSSSVVVSKDLFGEEKAEVSNAILSLAHQPIAIADGIFDIPSTYNFSFFGYAPTNQDSREKEKYFGGTGVSVGIQLSPVNWAQASKIGYTLSLLKNYHEFERNVDRAANLSHRIRHTVTYEQKLAKKINVELLGRYQTGFTYQNAIRTSFALSEAIAYSIGPDSDIYLIHTNEGNALDANGRDSNIDLYDSNHSVWGTGLRRQF